MHFGNSMLPKDEICIVKPPVSCPRSKPGDYWKLNKTFYDLARIAHYWYTIILNHIINDLGFESMLM